MEQDWKERDRMLTEVHSDMKHMVKWADDHTKEDNDRFSVITKDIEVGKKVLWGGLGIVSALEFFIVMFIK